MSYLFISSTGDHAGQSIAACAVALRLLEKKIKPGIFKPFGTGLVRIDDMWTDPDAQLFKEILNLKDSLDMICPYLISEKVETLHGPVEILEKIKYLAHELLKEKDIVLILGSKHIFFDDAPYSLPDVSLMSELNADLGDVKDQVLPSLSKNGISNIAVLPEEPFLSLRSIEEIRERLDGKIIWGDEYLDRLVGGITVGMPGMDKGLMIFKRIYNKIVLLEPSTVSRKIAGILLTGNREPARQVLEAARKSQIPLILIKEDSFVAKEHLEKSVASLSPGDIKKILHFMTMLDSDDFLNRLIGTLSKK